MRKTLALTTPVLALLALGATGAQAQLSVGLRGGLVSAQFGGDIDYNARMGFYVGAFAGISLGEIWSIEPEVALVQKGATDENLRATPGGTTVFDRNNRLTYVEVSVPLTYSPRVESRGVRPRLYAAPAVAFEASCTTEFDNAPELTESFECHEVISVLDGRAFTRTKSIDFGVVLGAGLDAGRGRTRFTVDVRYDVGITDINDLGGQEIKNRALLFLVGVRYGLSS